MCDIATFWLDGVPATALPLPDRGLDFGDGLFETLLLRAGTPLYLDLHLARLRRGLHILNFPDCLTLARDRILQAAEASKSLTWAILRLTVSRGEGARGYAPPAPATPRMVISASHLNRDGSLMQSPLSITLAGVGWPSQPLLARIKHLNRLEQVLAADNYRRQGFDEAVMQDQAGKLVSVVAGNLFIRSGQVLYTPELVDSGIAGTRRQLIIERWAPAVGLKVEETNLEMAQLLAADEVFISNSLLGLRPVGRCGSSHWSGFEACSALFKAYVAELP